MKINVSLESLPPVARQLHQLAMRAKLVASYLRKTPESLGHRASASEVFKDYEELRTTYTLMDANQNPRELPDGVVPSDNWPRLKSDAGDLPSMDLASTLTQLAKTAEANAQAQIACSIVAGNWYPPVIEIDVPLEF